MITDKELANLIFPDVTETLDDLEKRYPKRDLPDGGEVTRFAPSPTGFLHTGSLFTAMICRKVATQTGGIFYIRLEDTDTKREIQGSGEQLLTQLKLFDVVPDEGYLANEEKGDYGPYKQSDRANIYKIAIKNLLERGLAYPCFATQEELNEIRKRQEEMKIIPGYYGQFARDRFLTNDERKEKILNGVPFVIRFKSQGNHLRKIKVRDEIHGEFEIAQNDQDIVIFKSDGLPTYHFAHAVDDHFMRTTTVIRGEEWIASLPIHVELFEALGFRAPKYAHLPVIMKLDENNHKRKLSKRLDSEAAVSFFLEDGYPSEALIVYLNTIANSNFEEWVFENGYRDISKFEFSFEKMSLEGALFDIDKLTFFAKEILATKTKEEMLDMAISYASKYDETLLNLINRDPNYFKEIMNIEREKENPRKDYYKFGGMSDTIDFFYGDIYDSLVATNGLIYNEKFDKQLIKTILGLLRDNLDTSKEESLWFADMKAIALDNKFAPNGKTLKQNPDTYIGTVGDVAEMLRISLTTRRNSPNLYYVMKVLGKEECDRRLTNIIENL